MAAAVLFGAASCVKEDISSSLSKGEVEVAFTVNMADLGTRAADVYGDASHVDVVYLGVYEQNSTTPLTGLVEADGYDVIDGVANFSVVLLKDKYYDLVFWAQKDGIDCYEMKWNARKLVVKYTNVASQDETRDAFFLVKNGFHAGYDKTEFKLNRPFAQLNVGLSAEDVENIKNNGVKVNNLKSEAVVKNIANVLYLGSDNAGNVDGEVKVTFASAAKPEQKLSVNGEKYNYLSMNYLLVNDKQNIDVTYTFVEDGVNETPYVRDYYNVPVQRNFRTNILGNLISSPMDFTVIIDSKFNKPSTDIDVWDGSVTEPDYDEQTNTYIVDSGSDLAWLANIVNGTSSRANGDSFAGKTFSLTNDINLDGQEWTPIGTSDNPFKGTFDGAGHTISGLVISGEGKSNIGLFGFTTDGEVKNLTVNGAKVTGRLNVGVVAGQPYTSKYTNITVKGHIEVNGMAYVGAVGGKNAYADWTNITVEADETSYVNANSIENGTAYRTYVGGVVGFNGEGGHKFSNITSNINVKGSTCDVGGLFGIAHYNNQFENCVCTGNVEIYAAEEAEEAQEMGGIAGVWHNENGTTVTMTNCSFDGTLTSNIEGVVFYNNGLVGKPYSATGTGKLLIDGKTYVSNVEELQAALNAATGESTIYLGANIVGTVTAIQKQGVKITIDGEGKKYNGVIKVHSNSNYYADAALTIKNVNFETSAASVNVIEALENGSERYSNNITVENCTFTATGEAINTSVAVQVKATRGVTVKNCTATNMHSLIQAQSCDTGDVKVVNCKVNGKNGVAFKQVKAATVEGTTITALEYGIRFDGNIDNYGIVVKNNNVTAVQPLIVRKMTGKNNTIALDGTNTLTTEAEYQIVITNGSDDAEYVKPTGTYTLNGADNYTVFPAPIIVSTADELVAALEAKEDVVFANDIKIEPAKMSNAYGTTGINVKYGQTIDGNGYTLNIKGAGGTWDSGINTTGGVIKNLTVTGSFRGIFINHTSTYSEKVVLENVTIGGNGTVYTISCDQGLYQTIEATNCTFNGWTSFADTAGEAKFVNCYFGEGSGYKDCRPYSNTEFVECTFCPGYAVDTTCATVTFTDCTWEE